MRLFSLSRLAFAILMAHAFTLGSSFAAIFPVENAVLNYRIIGFSFAPVGSAVEYRVEIARGTINEPTKFIPEIITSSSDSTRILSEVPSFGYPYTWRVVYRTKSESVAGELHHFSTGIVPFADTGQARLIVSRKGSRNEKFYVMIDGIDVMYDANGTPVWYLPPPSNVLVNACDLKPTPGHSLSYIAAPDAYEVDYSGKVLWTTPGAGGPGSEQGALKFPVHHEFTKLNNGHYMMLCGGTAIPAPERQTGEPAGDHKDGNRHFFAGDLESALREYDSSGNIVWTWRSSDYLKNSDLGSFYDDMHRIRNEVINSHENSFFFDERNRIVYLSYVTFNRVIKIEYPSGHVIGFYGPVYDSSAGRVLMASGRTDVAHLVSKELFNNKNFSGQHNCRLTGDGKMMLFNNNLLDSGKAPSVEVFDETSTGLPGTLRKSWEFECPIGDVQSGMQNGGGGSVIPWSNGRIFVSMNNPYSKLLLVNQDHTVPWSAMPQEKQGADWKPAMQYRASILSQAELEQLVWRGVDDAEEAASPATSSTN